MRDVAVGEGLAGQTASKWVPALCNGMPAIFLIVDELIEGYAVWGVCDEVSTASFA